MVINMLYIKVFMFLNVLLSVKKNFGFMFYYFRDVERLRRFFFWSLFIMVVRLNLYVFMDLFVVFI